MKSGGRPSKILNTIRKSDVSETKTIDETMIAFLENFVPSHTNRIERYVNDASRREIFGIEEEEIRKAI